MEVVSKLKRQTCRSFDSRFLKTYNCKLSFFKTMRFLIKIIPEIIITTTCCTCLCTWMVITYHQPVKLKINPKTWAKVSMTRLQLVTINIVQCLLDFFCVHLAGAADLYLTLPFVLTFLCDSEFTSTITACSIILTWSCLPHNQQAIVCIIFVV